MSTTLVCGFEFEPTSESELPESYKTQTITKKGLEAHPDRENLVLSVKVRGRVCIRLLATSAYQKRYQTNHVQIRVGGVVSFSPEVESK